MDESTGQILDSNKKQQIYQLKHSFLFCQIELSEIKIKVSK